MKSSIPFLKNAVPPSGAQLTFMSAIFFMISATMPAESTKEIGSPPEPAKLHFQTANSLPQSEKTIEPPESEPQRQFSEIKSPAVERRQIFSRENIDDINAQSLPELFEAAGVQIKSYGAYGNSAAPSIRGFSGSAIKVIVDGICVNSAQNGTFDFSSFDVGSIERLEVARGSFSEDAAADGGAAIIYITTKKQSFGHHFRASASAKTYFQNPFDTYASSARYDGQISENTFLKTGGRFVFAENEFMLKNAQGKNEANMNNKVFDGAADAAVSHHFGGGNSLTFSERFYGGRKNINGPKYLPIDGIQQDCNNILSASVDAPMAAEKLNLKAALGWISNNQSYETKYEHSRHTLNELAFSGAASMNAAGFLRESLGTQLQIAFLESTDTGAAAQFSGFIKSTTEFALGETFTFLIPLSMAFSNENFMPVPKFGIRADFPHISLTLNGSRLYLFPDMNQLYWKDSGMSAGNPDLRPEHGWGGEFTADVYDIFLPFSISLYTNYYSSKIQWVENGEKWMPQNISSVFYAGINFLAEKTFFKCLTLRAQYEYIYNRLLDEGITHGNKIMYTPEHAASASATYGARFATICMDAHYASRRYISNFNDKWLEPYVLLNASINFKPAKWIAPYIKINNILNADYEQSEGYPMPGISLESGIKCRW